MTTSIMKTLVSAVVIKVDDEFDSTTTTSIGFDEKMSELKKSDLWTMAEKFGLFGKGDISDNGEICEMEDIWAEMIAKKIDWRFPNFQMNP